MSPMFRLVLLSCLAWAWGCSVPSLDQVEQANPRAYACNDSHPCPSSPSQVCIAGQCVVGACLPGSTQSCSIPPVGQCGPSAQVCADDGTFGECKPTQNSMTEAACSGADLNCDGRFGKDTRIAQRLRAGNFQSSVLLSTGTSLMSVTAEVGDAAATRLGFYKTSLSDGAATQVATYTCDQGRSCLSPALLSATDKTNVLAWIEQDAGGSASFTLKVGQLSEEGRLSRSASILLPLLPSPTGSNLYVTGLTLASNATTLLVLVSTSTASASAEDTTGTRQTLMLTLPLGGDTRSFSQPQVLANPKQAYGLYATASGDGTGFLVAYEDGGAVYTRGVNNAGFPDAAPLFAPGAQTGTVHSPFIAPVSGTARDHSIYFVSDLATQSKIAFVSCKVDSSSAVSCTTLLRTVYMSTKTILRARMSSKAGSTDPGFALIVEQGEAQQSTLSVTVLPNSTIDAARPLVNFGTFEEMMFTVPTISDRDFLVYGQRSDATASPEAHLLQFCPP
jgi:hypothetical protein